MFVLLIRIQVYSYETNATLVLCGFRVLFKLQDPLQGNAKLGSCGSWTFIAYDPLGEPN